MSLVERAARRLEELRKERSSPVSGDLAYPSSQSEAAPSLVERAVRKLEARDTKGTRSEYAPPAAQVEEPATSINTDGVDRAGLVRREPKLVGAAPQVPMVAGGSHRSWDVELDLDRLASAGYLKPDDPESAIANEFRKIKRPLIKACQGKLAAPVQKASRIMVTSSIEGEGKSFVSLNLALSIAMERDSTVLLIDADTTRRRLSHLIGIESSPGLLDLLAGAEADVSGALLRTNIERLTILPAGVPRRHATELLASEGMERLVEHLASRYTDRILIFDAPPLLGAPEPAVLASHMGQIIVVVEADKTTHKVLTNALATIRSCPLVTTILNKASTPEHGHYYYYAAQSGD